MDTDQSPILITAFGFQPDYIREISNAYARAGRKVILIGSDHHDKNWYDNNVLFINMRGNDKPERSTVRKFLDLFYYFLKLYNFILKNRIEYIYDPSIGRPFIFLINYISLKFLKRKVILTVHNVLPHSKYNKKNKLLYSIIYKYLTYRLIVHTEYIKNELVRIFRISSDKIILAHHGTYIVKNNTTLTKQLARSHLNIDKNEFIILVFGQQYPYKGTHKLISNYLKDLDINFRLIIRGAGSKQYTDILTNLIYKCNYANKIDADFNYVKSEDVELYFKSCDLVILPYTEGSQSGVLFMSYAYGRPVLVSDIGNFRNDILQGVTGEIFKPDDENDFKRKLKYIYYNLNNYNEDNIKKFAEDNYSWDTFAKMVLNSIYN